MWGEGQSVKYEEVYPNAYTTPREAWQGLTRYLTFYNDERPHQALTEHMPAEVCCRPSARHCGKLAEPVG